MQWPQSPHHAQAAGERERDRENRGCASRVRLPATSKGWVGMALLSGNRCVKHPTTLPAVKATGAGHWTQTRCTCLFTHTHTHRGCWRAWGVGTGIQPHAMTRSFQMAFDRGSPWRRAPPPSSKVQVQGGVQGPPPPNPSPLSGDPCLKDADTGRHLPKVTGAPQEVGLPFGGTSFFGGAGGKGAAAF